MKKKASGMKTMLRYVLRVEIDVDPEDAADISELIQHNREIGKCEVEDISVVEIDESEL